MKNGAKLELSIHTESVFIIIGTLNDEYWLDTSNSGCTY